MVANDQSQIPQLDKMLNEYRSVAGADVITAGVATKEIIRAMQNNEVVSLVLDQGGKTGLVVPFFGKTASMSNFSSSNFPLGMVLMSKSSTFF